MDVGCWGTGPPLLPPPARGPEPGQLLQPWRGTDQSHPAGTLCPAEPAPGQDSTGELPGTSGQQPPGTDSHGQPRLGTSLCSGHCGGTEGSWSVWQSHVCPHRAAGSPLVPRWVMPAPSLRSTCNWIWVILGCCQGWVLSTSHTHTSCCYFGAAGPPPLFSPPLLLLKPEVGSWGVCLRILKSWAPGGAPSAV